MMLLIYIHTLPHKICSIHDSSSLTLNVLTKRIVFWPLFEMDEMGNETRVMEKRALVHVPLVVTSCVSG